MFASCLQDEVPRRDASSRNRKITGGIGANNKG